MAALLDGGSGRRKKGGSFVSQRPREPKKVERNGMDGDTLSAGMGVFLLSPLCAKAAAARKDESEAGQVSCNGGFQIVPLDGYL